MIKITDKDDSKKVRVFRYLFIVQLIIYLIASFFPEFRIFGFSIWAHFPFLAVLGLFSISLVTALWVADSSGGRSYKSKKKKRADIFMRWALLISTLIGLLFLIARSQTHFLGDGYTVLANYALPEPIIKYREVGEAMTHLWVRNLFGPGGERASLLSFQVISIGCGFIYLILVTWSAFKLFDHQLKRFLFFASMSTGGYMLLFFGYVELYSIFVLMVVLFCLSGLLIARKMLSRWVILVPTILAITAHIMGVTLVPAAIYLLFQGTKPGYLVAGSSKLWKVFCALFLTGAGLILFSHFYNSNQFFRFAFLPIIEGRFTIDHYTMFSLNHLVDIANHLFLLIPGLPILLWVIITAEVKILNVSNRFLLVATLSTLLALLLFDPKLGMARDWDLFSFVAVPLLLLLINIIIDQADKIRFAKTGVILAVLLSTTVLCARVVAQINPDIAVARVKDFMALDKTRNRINWFILSEYYRKTGNSAEAKRIRKQWRKLHPAQVILEKATTLAGAGEYAEALELNKKAISLNSMIHESYAALGSCYLMLDSNELALENLLIATGLNPHTSSAQTNLGSVYFRLERYEEAEEAWLHSLTLEKSFIPLLNLSRLYGKTGRKEKRREFLLKAAAKPNLPASVIAELAKFYVDENEFPKAVKSYERALAMGLDSANVFKVVAENESFRIYLQGTSK